MNISVKQLRFGYSKTHPVVEPMSFSVGDSDSVAIVGSSGCGKSTLLRIISGLLPNSRSQVFEGQVLINGQNIVEDKRYWRNLRASGKIGFMFQDPTLIPNRSVERNIYLPLDILGKSRSGHKLVANYLQLTGLAREKHKLPHQLSGGMKTRVALARTFITGPELLLMDEPFAALDIVWKSQLYTELLNLKNAQQSSLILVTHDIFEALFLSPRILVMGGPDSFTEVSVPNWRQTHSYDDVVNTHHETFVHIKAIIEAAHRGRHE